MQTPSYNYRAFLVRYLRPHRPRVALLAALLLSSIGLQLLNPQILRYFIDTAAAGGVVRALLGAAVLFMIVALSGQAVSVAATYLGEQVGWLATNALRADLAAHCLDLDMPFHNARTPGELIERVDGDVTALANFFSQFVVQVLGSILLLVGVLALLFREDWRVGLALTVFALVALAVLRRSQNLAVPAMAAERESNARLFGFIEERLAGLDDIRANGAGAYVMRGFHRWMRDLFHTERKAWVMEAWLWIITTALFIVGYALALASGAYLFQAGSMSIGTVYLIFQYTEMLRRPLEQLTEQLKEFQRATASIGRVQELYDEQSSILDGPGATIPSGPLPVEMEDVSFGYGEEGRVLRNVSFRLEPGKVLGLLGRTGSGKTTVTRLLFRLYDRDTGAIRLGGVDIEAARLAELRQRVGMVTQEVQLFQATVRDNLTLFDPSISDARIEEVLCEMGLWAWYASLPAGLETELAPGGGGLSAGEAQLIAFTRVFLKDPGLVILDEASSRLDPATEHLIQRAGEKLLHNRTGIIIAHRLHTVHRADEIMILEGGHVREYGARERLANDPDSRFARLLRPEGTRGLEEILA